MLIDLNFIKFLRDKRLSGSEQLIYFYLILCNDESPSLKNISNVFGIKPGPISRIISRLKKKKVINIQRKLNGSSVKVFYSLVKQS
jgi:DNA-binding MarR family transcriptional regulator